MFWYNRKTAELTARQEFVSIHPAAEIAAEVEIGPFTTIGPDCRIGKGCRIHSNVTLFANVTMGEENEIYPGAVIGGLPQDKKYRGEETRVMIGDHNIIRENVTINSGTNLGGGLTLIGNRNLIMASCHIAHDCILENDLTLANNVLLGGHVKVESYVGIGGLAAVHHFVTIGQHAFVGGLARVTQDVPPYMLVGGNPSSIRYINLVGLKRRGFSTETLKILKQAHRWIYRSRKPRADVIQELLKRYSDQAEIKILVSFLRATAAGNQGRARQPYSRETPELPI
ncbi:MAG: acyl-ACP--UDP-N-acetylglucosamine O-acyltransferase [Planctomycetes bacterium]|nr:acyl-ACP--UDP-N-acetylglucosamine O-acyltransferase [Planctomycetota bacterium]